MQPLAVLFAIFVLSFVAGIGWYAGRGVVQFVAGIVASGGGYQAGRTLWARREEDPSVLRVVCTHTRRATDGLPFQFKS